MVKKIYVKPLLNEEQLMKLEGQLLPKNYFKKVIKNEDVDVYKEDGSILLKLRVNVLPMKNIEKAYNAMIKHARKQTTTRGMVGGPTGEKKLVTNNNKIMSNIIGYFDTLSVRQKWIFKQANMKKPICRETSFTGQLPNKWKEVIPLIKDIDTQYKKLFPKEYKIQHKAAQSTKYVIDNTAFSTITTNLNLQTACHYDKGDFRKGFGNLVVIEKGKYKGAYTGFPKYGIAVDLRNGDFLGMDVHELHGNEPIDKISKNAERLSLVSYLREGIYNKCQGLPLVTDSYFEKARKKAKLFRTRKHPKREYKKTQKNKKVKGKSYKKK